MSVSQKMHERLLRIDFFAARGKILCRKEVIAMFWDFDDDGFWDLDFEDFAITGAVWGLCEEEYDEEERLRKQLDEDSDDYYP